MRGFLFNQFFTKISIRNSKKSMKHKKVKLPWWRKLWQLRYRFYAILTLIILLPLLYASSSNVPQNIQVLGYEVVSSNILAQKIQRVRKTTNVSSSSSSSATKPSEKVRLDQTSEEVTEKLKSIGVNAGFIDVKLLDDLGIPSPVSKKEIELEKEKADQEKKKRPLNLDEIYPKPDASAQTNFIKIPNYNINAPIIYSSFEDLFLKNPDGTIDFNNPADTGDVNSPLQKKLQDGVVHIAFTPTPGEIGNSYIVGHSSNYSFIKSNYNQVFKPIERGGKIGEEFIIYDNYGRELKFRVFETGIIEERDVAEAYKIFDNRRVTTLQTSVVSWRAEKGLYPYQRWLVRGELICPDNNVCTR
jgi:sortase (surface protein transpeptidase)